MSGEIKTNLILTEGLKDVVESYNNTKDKFSCLLTGDSKTGKTITASTARTPNYFYMFDPGGARSIKDKVDNKTIFIDTRFDSDDPTKPYAFLKFKEDWDKKRSNGFFNDFATVTFDGLTLLSDIIMWNRLREMNRAGKFPEPSDWIPQMSMLANVIIQGLALKSDFICTAHIEIDKDEVTGRTQAFPLVTGKLKSKLAILFSDIYVTMVSKGVKGIDYSLLTMNDGYYKAGSRTGFKGKFEMFEKSDLRYLMEKGGLNSANLPEINI